MKQGDLERIHLLISGRVQGVGFRYSALRTADSLGLRGWVRNLPDGRVEVMAEGDRGILDEFVQWCRRGPAGANVTNVSIESRNGVESTSFKTFEIT
jgi:acylphosphatase